MLSRAEDRQLEGEDLDLAAALERAQSRWRSAAEARGIALVTEEGAAGRAWCARADLDRTLDALIENALAYSRPGGVVTLTAQDGRVEVLDRGTGLDVGEEELVFERFHRGRAGRQGPSGSGLGLAIARTLARAWEGEIRLGNRPGGGAAAVLELPRSGR